MRPTFDVCVIGLGPVGAVTAIALARLGFHVAGVDIDAQKIDLLGQGRLPFFEPGLSELLNLALTSGNFIATTDAKAVAVKSRIIIFATGTPAGADGIPDVSSLKNAAQTVGEAISGSDGKTIVVRSTVPPGTTRNVVAPILQAAGARGFHMVSNPEFLRRGKAVDDFFNPSRIVIGADSNQAAEPIDALYKAIDAPRMHVSIESAEFSKYADNAWHALKVAYANEMGRIISGFGGNIEETTRIFLADDRLNLSAAYLTPGLPFGGGCLPKDVQALSHLALEQGTHTPVIDAILKSNQQQLNQYVQRIVATGSLRIGLMGVAFKPGLRDAHQSPALTIASSLRQHGLTVFAHDKSFEENASLPLPQNGHLSLSSLTSVIEQAQCLVLFHEEYRAAAQASGKPVIDPASLR